MLTFRLPPSLGGRKEGAWTELGWAGLGWAGRGRAGLGGAYLDFHDTEVQHVLKCALWHQRVTSDEIKR